MSVPLKCFSLRCVDFFSCFAFLVRNSRSFQEAIALRCVFDDACLANPLDLSNLSPVRIAGRGKVCKSSLPPKCRQQKQKAAIFVTEYLSLSSEPRAFEIVVPF